MDFLDIKTVFFGQLLVQVLCAVVLVMVWRHNRRRYAGLHLWLADFVLQASAMLVLLLPGGTTAPFFVIPANLLVVTGQLSLYSGLAVFAGKPASSRLNLALFAGFFVALLYFTLVVPDFRLRSVNFNLFMAVYFARCIWLTLVYPPELVKLARPVRHTLVAAAAVSALRAGWALFFGRSTGLLETNPVDTALFFSYSGLLIMLTYSLFILVNRRLLADTNADFEGRLEAEKALRGALRVARLGTWNWDIKAGRLVWSEEMYSIFGIAPGTFSGNLGEVVADAIHPEDRPAVEASNAKVIREGKPEGLEYRVIWPDGSLHWVYAEASELVRDAAGSPALLKGYAQDITARKRTEEQLRDSAGRLELALASAGMGAWYWDIKEDRWHFDARVCGLLGLEPAVFRGTEAEILAVTHQADRVRMKKVLAQTLEGGDCFVEFRAVRPDGSTRDIAARGLLRRDGQGRPWRIDGMVWDITEIKRADAAMRSAQKLESLGTLAGGIAHDFNNILTGIAGNISLVRKVAAEGGDLGELLAEADSACLAAKGLARQLLTFASGGEPVKSPLDLGKLVRESVSFSLRGSSVSAAPEVRGGPLTVMGDKDQLFQVVQNLVMNAAQAMPGGGGIGVSLAPAEPGHAGAAGLPPGPYAELTVGDSGGGITEQVMARLFEPYFSTKGSGRGLGLAVARSIVLRHDGQITASSTPGAGSVFTVYLPLTSAPPAEAEAPAGAALKGGGRVLILDDEEIVYKALRRMLTALGFEAEVSVNGEEALKAWGDARAAGRPFSAAIMDLTITGGMGGAEAVKRLKQLDPAAKVLVSSGYAEDPVMADYAAHGFDGALSKPYRVEDLAAALSRLLG